MPGRNFSSSNYRYGFNGKELDKDINSSTSYDYGFRIYNPAIGKFLSVDPLSAQYPWYTPYQFAGNKPIAFIDLDGLEELLSIKKFREEAAKLGVIGNKRVGELFERMAVAALTGRSVTTFSNPDLNFYSKTREDRNGDKGPTQVRPDMLGFTFDISGTDNSKTDIRWGANQFFEVKITSSTITRSFRKGQIEGMIDVLSEQSKKSKNKAAELVIVTTEEFKMNEGILEYAFNKGVSISVIMAGIDEKGLIYFSELRQQQAGKSHDGVIDRVWNRIKDLFEKNGSGFEGKPGWEMKDFIEGISNKEKGVNSQADEIKNPIGGANNPDPIEVEEQ